eukprot:gnl/Dysnectes_brevis/2143_a2493_1973.p1 GENE.gnl/Dysnectes_brevis/2143_a2493_1973~~gnl/Dysnectes_brevis/2143_a2493_1973.p1  ORF type:complete len:319 (+),score=73.27 gnl/Dysnectes_brevis/2143_a2493_1973:26-982(+)
MRLFGRRDGEGREGRRPRPPQLGRNPPQRVPHIRPAMTLINLTVRLLMDLGEEYQYLENGGKVILPPDILALLMEKDMIHAGRPLFFRLHSPRNPRRCVHVGVQEFSGLPGSVYLPFWLLRETGLDVGEDVILKPVMLPPGKHVKVQAQSCDFLEIEDHKATLEAILPAFGCLTKGQIFQFMHEGKEYRIKVLESKPTSAISLIETQLTVDFERPLGYSTPPPPEVPKQLGAEDIERMEREEKNGWFSGSAHALGASTTHVEEAVHSSSYVPLPNRTSVAQPWPDVYMSEDEESTEETGSEPTPSGMVVPFRGSGHTL